MQIMTRAEIEQQLIEIVRREKKNLPTDLVLSSDTGLAGAGIDSLDSLTILFAIEEQFHITIPEAVARALKTFGDIVDAVAAELKVDN
jgi:acyl carrier protein